MRFTSILVNLSFLTLLSTGAACSKKDPLAELNAHAEKVCAATDYKSARKAWTDTLQFFDEHKETKELEEPGRQIITAIIDHAAVKEATGVAAKILTCAQKHGAL